MKIIEISDDLADQIQRVADVFGNSIDDLAEDFLDTYVSQLQESMGLLHLEIETRTWDDEAEALEVLSRISAHILHLEKRGDDGLPPGEFVVIPCNGVDEGRWAIRHVPTAEGRAS